MKLCLFFKHNKLDILGINETRIKSGRFDVIRRKVFRQFHVLNNNLYHPNGRLWVIWSRDDLSVRTLSVGNQWVHLQIEEVAIPSFLTTFVYGFNDALGRMELWDFLRCVSVQLSWVILGDFNCVRLVSERISSVPPNLAAISDFNNVIYGAGLSELNTVGHAFTWTNKQDGVARKLMRLDRALVYSSWHSVFPSSYVEASNASLSNHSPILVTVCPGVVPRPARFRYLNC
ncbi:hypothetical protein RND81_01G085200 [Saponaria officinalis]|uniref:Exo_endo_phos domain-containing protein n=1 Tax=Saponaria officinalis TaxID=3572 RepID=A0AAW1NCK9_SAPOF